VCTWYLACRCPAATPRHTFARLLASAGALFAAVFSSVCPQLTRYPAALSTFPSSPLVITSGLSIIPTISDDGHACCSRISSCTRSALAQEARRIVALRWSARSTAAMSGLRCRRLLPVAGWRHAVPRSAHFGWSICWLCIPSGGPASPGGVAVGLDAFRFLPSAPARPTGLALLAEGCRLTMSRSAVAVSVVAGCSVA